MADILTNLRELSVALFFYNGKRLSEIDPQYFLSQVKKYVKNTQHLSPFNLSNSGNAFNSLELNTIQNGFALGSVIKQKLHVAPQPQITWLGLQTHSDSPTDLQIEKYRFSLKEQSFIIENMGLYKLMNLLTGKPQYSRGQLHAFENFALPELREWFKVTRDLIVSYLVKSDFQFMKPGSYSSLMRLDGSSLLLSVEYRNGSIFQSRIQNFPKCSYELFRDQTNGDTREHVFSKFINKILNKNPEYIKAKLLCSTTAGQNIICEIENSKGNIVDNLQRFFRIEDEKYYYAKTTGSTILLYEVPAKKDFSSILKVADLSYAVPKSQLNIFTTLQNKETGKEIKFRSEVRYTHGQLNNIPEAKTYIESGDLTIVYRKIYP